MFEIENGGILKSIKLYEREKYYYLKFFNNDTHLTVNSLHYCTGGNFFLGIVTGGRIDTLTCMSFDFLQRRRKLNNSETTGQLSVNPSWWFQYHKWGQDEFFCATAATFEIDSFFFPPLQPLLNRILEVRSRYISRWHRWLNRPNVTLRSPTFCFSSFFLPSFSLFFLFSSHASLTWVISVFSQEISWWRFISNVIRTSNREQFQSWNETEIVIMIKSVVKENHFPMKISKLGMHKKKYKV